MSPMDNQKSLRFDISDETDAKGAVVNCSTFVSNHINDEAFAQRLATMVSELASNILKYAGHGIITIEVHPAFKGQRFDIESKDNGPGIINKERALTDGFSESGTLGMGLPGVRRMADDFTLDSDPRQGTRVFVRNYYPPLS